MDFSFLFSFHFFWTLLALANFLIQLAYFFKDSSRGLFIAKKITTPLLLFFGLFLVIYRTGGFPLIPGVILAAMGLGELGIEGSSVVESSEDETGAPQTTSVTVLLAGVLFLLVNIFIGGFLIFQGTMLGTLLICGLISAGVISLMLILTFRTFRPGSDIKVQMLLYSIGLVLLMTGAIADLFRGISLLGFAAVVLTVSDSLVLIRMGAGQNKKTVSGRRSLLIFLIVILLLYYLYMWILIRIGAPFPL